MGIDIFTSANSSIEALIQTTLQLEAQPRFRLEDKKDALNKRNTVLSELDSKLSKLNSIAKRLTDVITNHFGAKSSSSSDTALFTATADSSAFLASHDITIERLASSDTRVSQQYTSSSIDLKTFFDTNGSQTFQLEVAHPTATDKNNRVAISVTINSTGATNEDVLKDVALAINDAMTAAVTAGTIESDEKVTASVVHEEDGKSRLIFKSSQSGFTNRMVMTDSANTLLSSLGINTNVQSTGTAGGYITMVGTSATDSLLNSKLQVDGLTFYRDSNSINDILDGVTLSLAGTTTTTESLKVTANVEAVKQELQSLVDAYNDVIVYLKQKSLVDSDLGIRGVLAGDSTYSFLRSNLRSIFTSQVSGLQTTNPESLFEIGITGAKDGTLSFTDSDKFEAALLSGSTKISDLFNSTSGIANQIKTFLKGFIKVGGIIDGSQSSITSRLRSLDSQIDRFDGRLLRREQQLRSQFSRMQQASVLLGGQRSAFSAIFSSFRF